MVIFASAQEKTEKKDKAKLQEERLRNRKMLESCLTLVRSLYTKEEVILEQLKTFNIEKHSRFRHESPITDQGETDE